MSSLSIAVAILSCIGCVSSSNQVGLPDQHRLDHGQIVIHSNFKVPKHHHVIRNLTERREELSDLLGIPSSERPINVYLFQNEAEFRSFVLHAHPAFPNRRAFFVKTESSLDVYAFRGARLGEDLRHEVTHGYLHSVIENIPLWLDEGIAEYFEVPRGRGGLNAPHVYHLRNALKKNYWKPDLQRLESIQSPTDLTQTDYAEAWLWTHFLLSNDSQSRSILRNHLAALARGQSVGPLYPLIEAEFQDSQTRLIAHLIEIDETR